MPATIILPTEVIFSTVDLLRDLYYQDRKQGGSGLVFLERLHGISLLFAHDDYACSARVLDTLQEVQDHYFGRTEEHRAS